MNPPKFIWADYDPAAGRGSKWALYLTRKEQRGNRPDLTPMKFRVAPANEPELPTKPVWQPIATAPKDGTRILLACRQGNSDIPFFELGYYYFLGTKERLPQDPQTEYIWLPWENRRKTVPTHWLPLPEIPLEPCPASPVVTE